MLKIYNERITPPFAEQEYRHWAFWDALKQEQTKLKVEGCDDVRAANGVLSMLKIDNSECFAWEENDDKGWRIAWNGRTCKKCGDELEFGDDLQCGYHSLEE